MYQESFQDKNIYINLVDHLKTLDKLPLVCFVFSRKRYGSCDWGSGDRELTNSFPRITLGLCVMQM